MTMVGISAISAASVDDTISNDTQIDTTSYQEVSSQATDTNDNSINQVKQTNEKTSLSEGETGTLTDLASDISASEDTITLEKDYAGDSSELTPVSIDKNLIKKIESKYIELSKEKLHEISKLPIYGDKKNVNEGRGGRL